MSLVVAGFAVAAPTLCRCCCCSTPRICPSGSCRGRHGAPWAGVLMLPPVYCEEASKAEAAHEGAVGQGQGHDGLQPLRGPHQGNQERQSKVAQVGVRVDPPTLNAMEPPPTFSPTPRLYAGGWREARPTHPSVGADGRHPPRQRRARTPSRRRSILGSLLAERRKTPL